MMIKLLKSLKPAFYLNLAAVILEIVGFILFFRTFSIFRYAISKEVLSFTILSLWLIIGITCLSLINKKDLSYGIFVSIIAVLLIILSAIYFINPCLSPIGIYYTVNMGDMETYALGVPRCITGVVFYVLSGLLVIVGSFFNIVKNEEKEKLYEKEN